MKNTSINQHVNFSNILKFFERAFKFLFESNNNREFERLKDYIAS